MGMTIDSDIRRRAAARRSPLTFVRENWRAITLYLVITGALLLGLTQATEITVGILQFIAQLLFAMMFLIVQFGALFYILGRGRTYWVQPGETGVWFSDYRGNDQILEVARRVVTLLRGGWSLVIYPEGGRSRDGWGQQFRPGAAFLAKQAGVPVVPIAALKSPRRCSRWAWSNT